MSRKGTACRATAGAILVICLATTAAVAQPSIQQIKIGPPDFRNSDVASIGIGPYHVDNVPGNVGWAGALVSVHVLDNSEVDVDSVTSVESTEFFMLPALYPNPLGPRSDNQESAARLLKLFHVQYANSGLDVQQSDTLGTPPFFGFGLVNVHVKGTNVGENSDTDLVIEVYNMWHVRQDSSVIQLKGSDLVWGAYEQPPFHFTSTNPTHPLNSHLVVPVGSDIALSTGPNPSGGPGGRWWHLQAPVHGSLPPVHFMASQYFATLAETINVGIDHIPEPASLALFGLGVACMTMSVRSRMRRA